jgi:hypothetical protein
MAKKKNEPVTLPRIPLSDLSERYLHNMETEGKSRGTVFSYSMELGAAQKELGADTPIADITRADVIRFNESPRVTLLRSGKPKSQLSIDKTRRVLRLALGFAVQTGLLASSPAENYEAKRASEPAKQPEATPETPAKKRRSKKEAPATSECSVCRATFTPSDEFANACPDCAKTAEEEKALDAQPIVTEEPAAKRAPRASKKRRGAITLEVSQPEAEAAADAVEATLATTPEAQTEAS